MDSAMIENVQPTNEMWSTVELMGHAQTAGRISRPSDWGGLMRVDVPLNGNGEYRTEFYGVSAIYSVKVVSEEIARAFATPARAVVAYDTPIVTREQHTQVVTDLQRKQSFLERQVEELNRRLTNVGDMPLLQQPDEKLLKLATDVCAAYASAHDISDFGETVELLANEIGFEN
jgi:hypothetical protein